MIDIVWQLLYRNIRLFFQNYDMIKQEMITSKSDYLDYRKADQTANFQKSRIPRPFLDYCYRYLICLRKAEYYKNCRHDCFGKLLFLYFHFRLARLSVKTGIQLHENNFGKGQDLFHFGGIVVNETARFGDFCVIQNGVNISGGVKGGQQIYLAAGTKIIENISIADHCIIGSNAVITKNILESSTSWGGVPAHKISNKGFYYEIPIAKK